jgi:ParB family chromosome partitioning protein
MWEIAENLHRADLTVLERDEHIAECDENLCGSNLSAAERALFTRRRKDAYEALHPETKAGQAQAVGMNAAVGNNVAAKSAATFTADASKKTGQSERTIQRDAERGESIPEPILQQIAGDRVGARLIPTDAVT